MDENHKKVSFAYFIAKKVIKIDDEFWRENSLFSLNFSAKMDTTLLDQFDQTIYLKASNEVGMTLLMIICENGQKYVVIIDN